MSEYEVWIADLATIGMRNRIVIVTAESLGEASHEGRRLCGPEEFVRGVVEIEKAKEVTQ